MPPTRKVSLIVFGQTGHVLGAFTRTANPDGAVTPAQVALNGLVIRDPDTGDVVATVPEANLQVKNVNLLDDDVIVSHRNYVVENDVPLPRPALSASPVSYAAGTSTLTVTLVAAVTQDTKVWVQLESSTTGFKLLSVDVPDGQSSATMVIVLTPETYNVLVFAPGYRVRSATLTV